MIEVSSSLNSLMQGNSLELIRGGVREVDKELDGVKLSGMIKPGRVGDSGQIGGTGRVNFEGLLQGAIRQVDGADKVAQAEVMKLRAGESDNVHQAMIAMQEANTQLTLLVEVKNKLLECYQVLNRAMN